MDFVKGEKPKDAKYAHGGGQVGSRSRFMKTPDVFRTDIERTDYEKKSPGGELAATHGDGKSKKPVKPHTSAQEESSESGAERRREAKSGEE